MKHTILRHLSIATRTKTSNPLRGFMVATLISTCCFVTSPVCAQPPLYRLHMPTDTDSTNPQAGVPGSSAPASAAAATATAGSSFAPQHPFVAPDPAGHIEICRIGPALNTNMLKGVDTVVVHVTVWPSSQELFQQDDAALLTTTDDVRKLFADAVAGVPINQIKVLPISKDHDTLEVAFLQKPNVVMLDFIFSAREQSVGGKTVKVASMTWGIGKYEDRYPLSVSQGSAYPFVVPDDKEAKQQLIRDAVAHSLSPLLRYFSCAEKYGPPSHECPDCSAKVCSNLPSLMVQP
jgi:hypothetical protein